MLMSRLLGMGVRWWALALLLSCGGGDATGFIYLVGQGDSQRSRLTR